MLNAKQIEQEKLLKLENTHGKSAQVGYDLSIKAVNLIGNSKDLNAHRIGKVLKDKTELTNYSPIELINLEGNHGWILYPDTYDIVFNEGCKIPPNRVAFIKQRSSLWRNGALINSPIFDPGFETDNMGTTMLITKTIFIEKDARVAQIYFHECAPGDLYNGQWQNDRQRSSL